MKDRFLSVLKFFLAILLFPLTIGVTAGFWENLRYLPASVCGAFGWGVVSYLILHILLYEPSQVFDTGKKLTEKAAGFLFPMFRIAGFCIPIFTILSFVAFFFVGLIWKYDDSFPFFVFIAAFTLTMHLVFTANALKTKQAGWLKENYFFSIFIIYIINILIVSAAFNLLSGFSFLDFWRRAMDVAGAIYTASFRQLFVVEGR